VPPILGFDLTSTALAEQEIMLAATDADLNQRDRDAVERETQFALNAQATNLGLVNAEALLNQTATQSAANVIATATANAAESSRQRTQVALNYESTQVQLQNNATQVQLDFQNTQAALNGQGGGFEAQSLQVTVNPSVNPTATAIPPTPTSTVMLPPPSDTPTATTANIETDLREGFDDQHWREYGNAWAQNERGLRAITNNAVLLSREALWDDDFTIAVDIAPAIVLESSYTLLLNIVGEDVLAVQIDSSGLAADTIQLVQLRVDFQDGFTFISGFGTVLAEADVDVLFTSDTQLAATVENGTVTVNLNDTEILSAELPDELEAGQVGVILPQGSILQSIAVEEN
jgi:hypothetical protein